MEKDFKILKIWASINKTIEIEEEFLK